MPRAGAARASGRAGLRRPTAVRLSVVAFLVVGSVTLAGWTRRMESWAAAPLPLVPAPSYRPLLFDTLPAPGSSALEEAPLELVLEPGQTLGELLDDLGLRPEDAVAVMDAVGGHLDLRRLKPGLQVDRYGRGDRPSRLEVAVKGRGRLRVARRADRWQAEWRPFVRRVETRRLGGTVEHNLEGALLAAGGDYDLAVRMAEVLQWDVDFNRDLRRGDRFRVVFEEVYLDGRVAGTGQVLALSFENHGRLLEAFRYEDGYYDAEGRPLRKMFLRSPLRYSRISSRFSRHRFHPVLKRSRPHYGVDYAAPVGTPVRVTASGVVRFVGWTRGGGRTVKVRHPNSYLTAYLHLSRFAKGLRAGVRVSQGDVVGYVGASGLATGPHLDYRVEHRGRWIDPLSIQRVPADPVPTRDLPRFAALRDRLRHQLAGDGKPPEELRMAGLEPAPRSVTAR